MCGRNTRYLSWSEIHRLYRLTSPAETGRNDEPAYNAAPTDAAPFVTAGENGAHKLREGRPAVLGSRRDELEHLEPVDQPTKLRAVR